MFWNNSAELKAWMKRLNDILWRIDYKLEKVMGNTQDNAEMSGVSEFLDGKLCDLEECIKDAFYSEEEHNPLNRIHDKLNSLIEDSDRQKAVLLAQKTLDKFEDYMKNVDKLNSMVNEFKGCISMARGVLHKDKESKKTKKRSRSALKKPKKKEAFLALESK